MKIRLCEEQTKALFPKYPYTVSAYNPQDPISGTKTFHQIFSVVNGSGILHLEDNTYLLKKDDMFFIPKYVTHEYHGITPGFKTCFMGFDGIGCENIFSYFNTPKVGFCMGKITPRVYSQFKDMHSEFNRCSEAKICAMAYSLVIDFFENAVKKMSEPIDSVLNYIEENYALPLTLDDMLTVYPYSKTKLCRDFAKKYSMTVFEKLTDIRLKRAYFLLENQSELKINTIAQKCGYTDLSYFCRMFKRAYGKSPGDIRKESGLKEK